MIEITATRADLIREPAKIFPRIDSPHTVSSLRVWHCKYKSLAPVGELVNLEELIIATFPDPSLDFLRNLRKLRYLSVLHLPKVTSVEALSELKDLETLSLRTLPSWDSSSKRTLVETFEPLRSLPRLKHIELIGVEAKESPFEVLKSLPSLKTMLVSGLAKEECAKLVEAGVEESGAPWSSFG